jgi:hypothetical protein
MVVQAFSVVVAALAVVVSAITQARTIRMTRVTSAATILGGATQAANTDLRKTLSEYLHLSYKIDTAWRHHRVVEDVWPGQSWDNLQREDELYTTIRLHLDASHAEDAAFLTKLEKLRDLDSDDTWLDRRDAAADEAVRMFTARMRRAVAEPIATSSA